jgi:hypothetical protein
VPLKTLILRNLLPLLLFVFLAIGQHNALFGTQSPLNEWIADAESADETGNRGEKAQDEENQSLEAVHSDNLISPYILPLIVTSLFDFTAFHSVPSATMVDSPPEIG